MEAFAPPNCGLDSPEFLPEPVVVSAGAVVIAALQFVKVGGLKERLSNKYDTPPES